MAITIEEKLEVMKAYLEGKTIQFKNRKKEDDDSWENANPTWDWDLFDYRIKPEESDEPKKLMTCRQLAELMAKGYGQNAYFYKDGTSRIVDDSFEYEKDNEDKSVFSGRKIRAWGSDEWIEPTVDIYEEYIAKWNRAFKEIEIKEVLSEKAEEDTIKDYSDASKVEPKVGEVFKYNGMTLKCVEGDSCEDCVLTKTDCNPTECRQSKRSDGKMVFFVDVSKTENTTASEDSSATVSKEESVGVHKRTPQEIADFFNCYVAMNEKGSWYLYNHEPMLTPFGPIWFSQRGDAFAFGSSDANVFLFLEVPEDHDWRTLYRPHQEPIVMEEEDDD